jgi:hypothetical protein
MLTEQQQDGHLILYPAAPLMGRQKLLLHVNGVGSDAAKQLRDLEALVWLTLERPCDVMGIHNSTSGLQADLLESLLGKAELYRFYPENVTSEIKTRLQGYGNLLKQLSAVDLAADTDVLQVLEQLQSSQLVKPQGMNAMRLDPEIIRRLPFVQKMGWSEFESYFYGSYPAGAPRPTLRLAYEILKGIRAGNEVYVVAHSQGMIIAAIAFHILQAFFGTYTQWWPNIRFIGYGPVVMFADLPADLRSQTIMIQHRRDPLAEVLSNIRNVGFWGNLQTQVKGMIENSETLFRSINTDSHHSASLYLGLQGNSSGDRSSKLISLLLTQDWNISPFIQPLRASRIIIEESAEEVNALG